MNGVGFHHLAAAFLASSAAFALAAPAQAQTDAAQAPEATADSGQIADIVVTARRREEKAQSLPIAITAISAADIAKLGARSAPDAVRSVPGLQFDVGGGISGNAFTSSIYIRGVGQNEYLATSDPGVALYIDGVYYARQVGSVFDLADIKDLEVLRGPQGTLFGKNALGGALNVTTTAPADKFSALVQGNVGSYGRADAGLVVTGPIIPGKLNAKLAVQYRGYDGYGRQFNGVRTNDEDTVLARGALLFKPTDKFDITLAFDGQIRRQHPVTQHIVSLTPGPFPDGSANYPTFLWNQLVAPVVGTRFGTNQLTDSIYTSNSTGGTRSDLDNSGISLTGEYRFNDALKIKSITAYRHLITKSDHDNSASSVGLNTESDVDRQDQFSQELQLSGSAYQIIDYTAGFYYFHELPRYRNSTVNFPGLYDALTTIFNQIGQPAFQQAFGIPVPSVLALNFNLYGRDEVDNYAGYAQGTLHLGSKIALTGGVRYTDESKSLDFSQTEALTNTCVLDPARTAAQCLYNVKQRWTDWSPRGDITYKPFNGLLLYGSISKGFKSGGFNGRAQSPDLLTPYNPETLYAYEIGFKSDFLDRHARLNVSAYINEYNNIQLDGSRTGPNGALQTFTLNGGQARIRGVEAELLLKPIRAFTFNGSFAYTDARYTKLSCNVIGYFNGGINLCDANNVFNGTAEQRALAFNEKLPRTPEFTYSLGGTYVLPLGRKYGTLTANASYNYRSRVFYDARNAVGSEQGPYGLGNARIAWEEPSGHVTIGFSVSNFTDRQYYNNVFAGTQSANGAIIGNPGAPRQWNLDASLRF